MTKAFPVIDPMATGQNILRLRKSRGLSVRELQDWFGFEEPQAIYKWQKGKSLPTVDNLYALSALLNVPMQDILVPRTPQLNKTNGAVSNEICPLFCVKFQFSVPLPPVVIAKPVRVSGCGNPYPCRDRPPGRS